MSLSSERFKDKNKHLVELGIITSPHGIKGAVKIKTFTQMPESLVAYGPLSDQNGVQRAVHIIEVKTVNSVVAQIEGVSDRNEAEALRGTFLYAKRENLPPVESDEFYHSDLIGMAVKDLDEATVGTVKSVFNFGAGDILDILTADGKSVFVPFHRESVPVVDVPKKYLIVDGSYLLLNVPESSKEHC